MGQNGLKNMIVLKDFQSNIVEEAIIILKRNINIKENKKTEKSKESENKGLKTEKKNDYILKEAEMLISNYVSKLEKNKKDKEILQNKINKKCKRFKKIIVLMSAIIILEAVLILIK